MIAWPEAKIRHAARKMERATARRGGSGGRPGDERGGERESFEQTLGQSFAKWWLPDG
jgi:hypothetical protein